MSIYKVTVSVRGVVSVEAKSDAEAGTIAYDYLDGCMKSGQATVPMPVEVRNVSCNTFVQSTTTEKVNDSIVPYRKTR